MRVNGQVSLPVIISNITKECYLNCQQGLEDHRGAAGQHLVRPLGDNILEVFQGKLDLLHEAVRVAGGAEVAGHRGGGGAHLTPAAAAAAEVIRRARLLGQLDKFLAAAAASVVVMLRCGGRAAAGRMLESIKKVLLEGVGPGSEGSALLLHASRHPPLVVVVVVAAADVRQ